VNNGNQLLLTICHIQRQIWTVKSSSFAQSLRNDYDDLGYAKVLHVYWLRKLSVLFVIQILLSSQSRQNKRIKHTTAGDGTWMLVTECGRMWFARWHKITPSCNAPSKSSGNFIFNIVSIICNKKIYINILRANNVRYLICSSQSEKFMYNSSV